MSTLTALEEIEQIEKKIQELKHEALAEMKEKLIAAKKAVIDFEKELAELTGAPLDMDAAPAAAAPVRRTRRPSVSDADLKPLVLQAMAQQGMNGLNAKDIGVLVGQDAMRIRRFIAENPTVLKRQGSGPGTRFFLR